MLSCLMGENIRNFRTMRNFTQEQLSEAIGISPAGISKIERGLMWPSPAVLSRIISVLEISPYMLLLTEKETKIQLTLEIGKLKIEGKTEL